MKLLKIFIAIAIAYASFKISIPITNSLVHFEIGLGTWVINLFILSPIYLVVLLGLTGLMGFGAWYILSYILILSVINMENNNNPSKDTTTTHTQKNIQPPSIISMFGKTLMGTLGMIGVAIAILMFGMATIIQTGDSFSESNKKRFEKKFNTVHPSTNYSEEEFNIKAAEITATDYRFIFYLKELNIASINFVNADKVIDIFEADVKRELATACMRDILTEKVSNTSFDTIKGYKMNALNAVGNMHKAMKNIKLMDKDRPVYHYPRTYGYGNYILDKDYGNRCNETMSVDDMLDKYLPIYIKDKKVDAGKARLSKNPLRVKYSTKAYAWIDKL